MFKDVTRVLVLFGVLTAWSSAHAAKCDNATASLCWKMVEGKKMVECVGELGEGENGPATTTVSYTEGGTSSSASGTAKGTRKKAKIGIAAPSNNETEVTASVKGSNCEAAQKAKKKMKDIPAC